MLPNVDAVVRRMMPLKKNVKVDRDAGSSTSSCESAPSSSCRSSCHRVPAGRIWGCHWTAIRRCGAPPMWFAACRSPWASCQQNWTWPWLPTVANRATVGSQWVRAGGRKKWADFGPGTLILIKFRRNPEISSTPYFESNFEKSGSKPNVVVWSAATQSAAARAAAARGAACRHSRVVGPWCGAAEGVVISVRVRCHV